ncbi:MAG: ATP-binding protein [Deltaproteobacteria bacterium]|nr:ATP-binding protein [Deltaproteobacteria bacterium]
MFARSAVQYLSQWFGKKRRKPLILRGARQVGKSTLVRLFVESANLSLHEINLERHLFLDDIFKSLDMTVIVRELEVLAGASINAPGSCLFLDEIQATPYALQALRYFYEEYPDLPVIAAGSLLEFTLADHSFSMPVGRIEYFHLYPLTFREFLSVIKPALLPYLDTLSPSAEEIPYAAHQQLLKKLRDYFFVGGLPEAVQVFADSESLQEVAAVHRSIVSTYQDDFSKYTRQNDLFLIQKIFNYIPKSLGKKVKYTNISRDNRAAQVKKGISLLTKARICHQVKHSHCTGLPLAAESSDSVYKMIFMDIGLVNHICGCDWRTMAAFDDRQLVNEGGIAEQFVGQHLIDISGGLDQPSLYYWLREKKSSNAEVDYVIGSAGLVLPVEVKSGTSGSLKSLQQFVYSKDINLAIRFDLNPSSLQQVENTIRTAQGNQKIRYTLLSLPLYGVQELERIVYENLQGI